MANLGEANIGGRMVPAWLLDLTAEELDSLKSRWYNNPNLLDNWYFVGGGSQQGDGQFPINQRGFTSAEATNTRTFDRWSIYLYSNGTVSLDSDGVSIAGTLDFGTAIESSRLPKIPGLVITISALNANGQLVTKTVSLLNNGTTQYVSEPLNWGGGGNLSYVRKWNNGDMDLFYFNLFGYTGPKIVAAKLELGDHQTLAHQDENENWVLNEIPNFHQELAKCQRYLLMGAMYSVHMTVGMAFLSTPVPMRTLPAIIGTPVAFTVSTNIVQPEVGLSVNPTFMHNGVVVNYAGAAEPCYVYFPAGSGLSCEL